MLLRFLGGDLEELAPYALSEFHRFTRLGPNMPLRVGLKRGHVVSDPPMLRQVLLDQVGNDDNRTPSFDVGRIVLGNGMLASDGNFWKRQRRITSLAFHGISAIGCGGVSGLRHRLDLSA